MRLAALVCTLVAGVRAQQASFEGAAVNALTKEPLSGVHVRLLNVAMTGVTSAYGAMSDRAGHFSIATLRPGMYILSCELPGYLHAQSKDSVIPTITFRAGQQLKDFKVLMTPRAILSGRVLDDNGDPVEEARVNAEALDDEILSILALGPMITTTDDRGEFRLALTQGKYYLRAAPMQGGTPQMAEHRNDGSIRPPLSATYYPSEIAKTSAQAVQAIGGKETGGLDIRLSRHRGYTISGVVSGIPKGTDLPVVHLRAPGGGRHTTQAGSDGKFLFRELEPGQYRVYATYEGPNTQLASRVIDTHLSAADVGPVNLSLGTPPEVSGTLVIEGDPPDTPPKKCAVRLRPVESGNRGLSMKGGEVDRDHAFHILGMIAGRYRIDVASLPENAYIRSVAVDGVEAADRTIDIADGANGARIKIVANRAGAQLSGRILDADGNRMNSLMAVVALMKNENDESGLDDDLSTDGKYTFKGIAPGKYHMCALNPLDFLARDGGWESAMKKVYPRCEEIEFKEGERVTKDLRQLPKEAPDAKK
jgi:hypothetical protein